jgi:hypothetical protein
MDRFGSEFVVAATEVLHDRESGEDDRSGDPSEQDVGKERLQSGDLSLDG